MLTDIHTEEELLREIEQEDDWFENLDLDSPEDVFEEIDEDEIILYEEEDDDNWVH
ncbi:MAG: hypothetical protein K0U40_11160 [Betaproteobacteria bacterium]|nr:hypothetical protein [Betaproteobacteria bacterium]